MPNHAYDRQSIPNLERKLVEVKIRVEKVALVFAACFEDKVLPVLLRKEELLSRAGLVGYALALPDVDSIAICALFVDNSLAVGPRDFYVTFGLSFAFEIALGWLV